MQTQIFTQDSCLICCVPCSWPSSLAVLHTSPLFQGRNKPVCIKMWKLKNDFSWLLPSEKEYFSFTWLSVLLAAKNLTFSVYRLQCKKKSAAQKKTQTNKQTKKEKSLPHVMMMLFYVEKSDILSRKRELHAGVQNPSNRLDFYMPYSNMVFQEMSLSAPLLFFSNTFWTCWPVSASLLCGCK